MASAGIPQADIAKVLGISCSTLTKYYADELATGRVKTITRVADALVKQALSGNITAMIFYLKTQGRWTEARPAPLEGGEGKKEQANTVAKTAHQSTEWAGLVN